MPQATYTKNLVKFGRAVFELCEWTEKETDAQTNRHSHHNALQPYRGERMMTMIDRTIKLCNDAIANMTARCDDKSKQTASSHTSPKIT